ncbi:MAG TPA: hypothetical protein VME21_00100 [Steroidobacteraceae bacterium]|nr:hypothetical protein [Steroidobacteraceae bacterium]
MEFLLLWWDELDDWVGAARHLAIATVDEVGGLRAPLTAGASAFGAWLLAAHLHAHAGLLLALGTRLSL